MLEVQNIDGHYRIQFRQGLRQMTTKTHFPIKSEKWLATTLGLHMKVSYFFETVLS